LFEDRGLVIDHTYQLDFGGNMDFTNMLEVWDSPNSAGVVIDALGCIKITLDRGIGGPLTGPSAYFMRSPPVQYRDDEAREMVEDFTG
jgi:myo-inositol-1-phosphate synthase